MEEKLEDIQSVRKNLLAISIISILIFCFAWDIQKVNIFWIIQMDNIESWKILTILLISLAYTYLRYIQYFIKNWVSVNQKLLIHYILSGNKIFENIIKIKTNKSIVNNKFDIDLESVEYKKNDILNFKYWTNRIMLILSGKYFKDIDDDSFVDMWIFDEYSNNEHLLSKDNIIWTIYSNKHQLTVILEDDTKSINYEKRERLNITLKLNKFKLIWYKIKYLFSEKYFSDYYFPMLLWFIAFILIIVKIYESNNLL